MILTSRVLSTPLTNAEVHHQLGLQVAREVLGATCENDHVEIGALTTNDYSFTFSVSVATRNGKRDVFVKTPKLDLRGTARSILPIDAGDRQVAQEEEDSLRLLENKWNTHDLAIYWATLRGIIPEFNAIITDRIFADEAFAVFRRFDMRRRLGFRQDGERLRHSMSRLGTALGRFHQANVKASVFRLSDELRKLTFYCREIASNTGSTWPDRIREQLESLSRTPLDAIHVPTLKGIDVRNVLIDAEDRLFLLDPGKTKNTYREADLARFVMTYRILYWGSRLLPLMRVPDPKAEHAFLDSYYSSSTPPSPQLFDLMLLKEQLKHWHTALGSLQHRPWSQFVKRLVARTYINPFYIRQVKTQFHALASKHG